MSSSGALGSFLVAGTQYRIFQNFWGKKGNYKKIFKPVNIQTGTYITVINQGPTVYGNVM
jgi:hypothetical protein